MLGPSARVVPRTRGRFAIPHPQFQLNPHSLSYHQRFSSPRILGVYRLLHPLCYWSARKLNLGGFT